MVLTKSVDVAKDTSSVCPLGKSNRAVIELKVEVKRDEGQREKHKGKRMN